MPHSTVAIVATVRNPGPSFTTWISYHLQQVDRLYICLDKPGTGDEQWIPSDSRIAVLAGSQESVLSGPSGVMQRQSANVSLALRLCRFEDITWLLHIDADELV